MKKVLLLRSKNHSANSPQYLEFASKIHANLQDIATVDNSSLERLVFDISNTRADIYDADTNASITDYDLIIIHVLTDEFQDEAHALATFCKAKHIRCIDDYSSEVTSNKLVRAVCFAINDIPTPRTVYGPTEKLAALLPEFGEKAIFKDSNGTKGRLNYLVSSAAELQKISAEHPDTRFVLQEFIKNSGDMRVVTINASAVLALHRSASGNSHINNTSQGGTATQLPIDELPPHIKDIAIRAAQSVNVVIAGVDIIISADTNQPFILEVNRTPQIATGAFQPEKVTAYSTAIRDLLTANSTPIA